MAMPQFNTVCYVGAGTMGCYNALVAAVCGYRAVMYDVNPATLAAVPQRQREMAAMLVGAGYCSEPGIVAAQARISVCPDLAEACSGAGLVSESVFERLDIKRDIHRRLDQICPATTLITTNSSALLVSDIEDVFVHGERFAALHSHLGSPLVDIVAGPRTAPGTTELLVQYVRSIRGEPLVLRKEYPGYMLNAMLGPLLRTSLALVSRGVATAEAVDRAWMNSAAAMMGPFGMMDLFGLKLIYDSWVDVEGEPLKKILQPGVIALLNARIEQGALGVNAGAGFYRYPDPAYQQPGFADERTGDRELARSLSTIVIAHGLLLAAHDIAQPADIDRAWKIGMSLPAGPFEMLNSMGQGAFRTALQEGVAANYIDTDRASLALDYLQGGVR